jgi:hypothetical protein
VHLSQDTPRHASRRVLAPPRVVYPAKRDTAHGRLSAANASPDSRRRDGHAMLVQCGEAIGMAAPSPKVRVSHRVGLAHGASVLVLKKNTSGTMFVVVFRLRGAMCAFRLALTVLHPNETPQRKAHPIQ